MKETGHGPEMVPPAEAAAQAAGAPQAKTVSPAEAVAQPAAAPDPGRRRWLILAVIGVAQLMVVLDRSAPLVN